MGVLKGSFRESWKYQVYEGPKKSSSPVIRKKGVRRILPGKPKFVMKGGCRMITDVTTVKVRGTVLVHSLGPSRRTDGQWIKHFRIKVEKTFTINYYYNHKDKN